MNIFVTGATGVLGSEVVPLLVTSGHEVRALSRSRHNIEVLGRLGAEPVSADLFDLTSLKQALAGSEAVLHLATRIPPLLRMGRLSAWRENDHLRREGTRNLVNAALSTSTHTFIYPSVCSLYADHGDQVIDASTARVSPNAVLQSTLDAETEVTRFTEAGTGRRGIVLRMGAFYGPTSSLALDVLQYARKGFVALPGPDTAYLPTIWVPDAASAIVAALHSTPAGMYDIVDNEVLTHGEMFAAIARSLGKHRLYHLPAPLMRLVAGTVAEVLSRSQRVSHRRFKEINNWTSSVPSARVGWQYLIEMRAKQKVLNR